MAHIISIDSSGCIKIPKEIREHLGLLDGGILEIECPGNHIKLRPVAQMSQTNDEETSGLLVIPKSGKDFNAVESLRREREERRGKK